MSAQNQRNKAAAVSYWRALDAAEPHRGADAAAGYMAADALWQGFHPVGQLRGPQALEDKYLAPLKNAFPSLERLTHILIGGRSDGKVAGGGDGRSWVGATGQLIGVQRREAWGIAATDREIRIRWSEFLEFDDDGRIVRIQMLLDLVDWLEQIGRSPLPRPNGAPFVWPAPTGCDGVLTGEQDPAASDDLLAYSRDFIFGGLNAFDRSDLKSMGMARYFHPNVKWYGPGGIGACLSLREFEEWHQRPWLVAFPDRRVQDLDNLIAEGDFVGGSSMPGVLATHSGPYLGHAPTGRPLAINGIDFWRRDKGMFTENWVFVDMPHLFAQMGVDLLAAAGRLGGPA